MPFTFLFALMGEHLDCFENVCINLLNMVDWLHICIHIMLKLVHNSPSCAYQEHWQKYPCIQKEFMSICKMRNGWVTSKYVSGSSLPMSVFGCITSFPPFICMQDRPHSLIRILSWKTMKKIKNLLVLVLCNHLFFPLDLSWLTPIKEGKKKKKSQESASTSERLQSN